MNKNHYLINCIHSIRKSVFLLGALSLSFNTLSADWDPEYCLINEDTSKLNCLQKPQFISLKEKVITYLAGSWCSKEKINLLMDLILITQPKVCVEIGACTGSSVLPVAATLQYLKHGKIFAIDAWSNAEAIKYLADNDPNKAWWGSVNMKDIHNAFQHTLKHWSLKDFCTIIRSPSKEAIHQVNNIDFLHLDGDYSEQGALEDVQTYLPKVKSGGYVLLSNLFIMVNGAQPKLKSFCELFEACEMICEIERDNAILFRKM